MLREILQSHYFPVSQKLRMVRRQNGLNPFLRIRGIVEQGWEQLFIISSSSHFFNKTDFEQYLVNEHCRVFSVNGKQVNARSYQRPHASLYKTVQVCKLL